MAAADFRAALRRKQQRDSTARDEADRDRALQAAREEAEGSGVIRFGLYVTVTAPDDRALQEAVAMTTSAADAARVQLRPLYGAQQLGFQTTLPTGVYPPALAGKWRR